MKQQLKWHVAALVVACGLSAGYSTQAQTIDLSTAVGGGGGGGWSSATFTSGSSVGSGGTGGVEVVAPVSGGYGYGYIDLGAGATLINPNSTQVTLTFTVNGNASDYVWMGVPLTLNDGTGFGTYSGKYSGSGNPGNQAGTVWNGNTVSITWDLNALQIGAIQGGSDTLYGFNTGVDPSSITTSSGNLDITLNSLTFSPTSVPEPTTMALVGLGLSGLLMIRRRR